MRGTAGPTTGTVQGFTKENYHLRSDERDREASFEPSSGPITGTHIHLPDGVGRKTRETTRKQAAASQS